MALGSLVSVVGSGGRAASTWTFWTTTLIDVLFIKAALPRIRDFRGVSPRCFDKNGNYTLGISDQSIFPEVELDKIKRNIGFDVTIVTTARTDEEAKSLLSEMGMPFSDRARPAAQPA